MQTPNAGGVDIGIRTGDDETITAWEYYAEAAKPPALFVFGDSYADTGNHDKHNPNVSQPWRIPYGQTWPGNPSGRYSDGFVLTDFIARFLNLPAPLPYSQVKEMPATGLDFAYGGSGVFDTYGPAYIPIRTQIEQFESLAQGNPVDYKNSLVLFVYSGNDYAVHFLKYGLTDLPILIPRIIEEIKLLLKRLHKLGFRRFAVTNLEPTGCLPFVRMPSGIMNCIQIDNFLTSMHNDLLSKALATLRTSSSHDAKYILLDQYSTFLEIFSSASDYGFGEDVLKSCCVGASTDTGCGAVDDSGEPLYKVCNDPSKAFFWDGAHPTEAGWKAVTWRFYPLIISLR
ncbi:hypothetical protein KP509_27G054900 [Ceratopteris richardii]|uniref:GDSL esterase/lipase n=1 Tax=Ceratopteris richardii TaxID=49495 RepID=A0A8T2RGE8_CERRI|nr:hypothetical protein KP509_27G054900 [Ceratopteris richardii]